MSLLDDLSKCCHLRLAYSYLIESLYASWMQGSRARALYNSGLRTPVTIAEASIPEIAKALFENSWSGQGRCSIYT